MSETVSALSGNENTAILLNGISVSDTPSTGDTLTTTLAVSHGNITVAATSGVTISDNDSGLVRLTGTAAEIDAALASGTNYTGETNYYGPDSLTVTTTEPSRPAGNNGTQTAGITLADTTTVAETVTALSGDENAAISLNGHVSVTDTPNTTDVVTTTLTVSSGSFDVTAANGTTVTYGDNHSTVQLVGTAAEIDAALAATNYQGNLNFYGTDTLTVTTTDATSGSTTGPQTATITLPTHEPPLPKPRSLTRRHPTLLVTTTLTFERQLDVPANHDRHLRRHHTRCTVRANTPPNYQPSLCPDLYGTHDHHGLQRDRNARSTRRPTRWQNLTALTPKTATPPLRYDPDLPLYRPLHPPATHLPPHPTRHCGAAALPEPTLTIPALSPPPPRRHHDGGRNRHGAERRRERGDLAQRACVGDGHAEHSDVVTTTLTVSSGSFDVTAANGTTVTSATTTARCNWLGRRRRLTRRWQPRTTRATSTSMAPTL